MISLSQRSVRLSLSIFTVVLSTQCGVSARPGTGGPDVPTAIADVLLSAETGGRDVPSVSARSAAGMPCMSNAMCNGLQCDLGTRDGICTAPCTDGRAAEEAAQCGGAGSTCLTRGDGPEAESQCARSCRPGPNTGCRDGYVCTGFWFTHEGGMSDVLGCSRHCQTDAHCMDGARCNVRIGQCDERGSDPARLRDGVACVPSEPGQPSPCRGFCTPIDPAQPTRGICGSFIDLARTQQCPDDPTMQPLGRGGQDNLAICLFRNCSATSCCGAGLVCEDIGMPEPACLPIDDPDNPNIDCTVVRDAGTSSDAQADAR